MLKCFIVTHNVQDVSLKSAVLICTCVSALPLFIKKLNYFIKMSPGCRWEAIRVYSDGLWEAVHGVLESVQASRRAHPRQALQLWPLRQDVPADVHARHAQEDGARGERDGGEWGPAVPAACWPGPPAPYSHHRYRNYTMATTQWSSSNGQFHNCQSWSFITVHGQF